MKAIKITFVLIAMVSTLFVSGLAAQAAMGDGANSQSIPAAADLGRVDWTLDHYDNPGFENWVEWYLPEDVSTYFTTEQYTWYSSSPWPVSEGSRSYGLQARALVPYQYPEARLTRSAWMYWNNPTNLTLSLDWYVDSLPTPVDGDVFELNVELGAPGDRELHYYFGCQTTTMTNSSWRAYFMMPGATGVWNAFDRNITADYFEVFGSYPVEFQLFNIYLRGRSAEYTRVFVDDLWMVNGSVIIGGSTQNGNFETGGAWYSATDYDPSIISQSTVREEGDYSLNVTVTSNGNQSRARVGSYPYRWLSVSNPSTFEFSWRLDELGAIDDNSYAWVYVSCTNGTEEFYLYYMLYSGPGFVFSYPDSIVINATGYNTTGQWNHFSRSIFADLDTFNTADLLKIDQIEFYSYARTTGARTVLLLDDVSLISGGFSDMSYEDQGDAGSDVYAWEDVDSRFSVTNTANSGQKAGNLTVVDGDNLWMQQEMGAIPVNEHRDMWVDLFWQIADGSGDEGNELYFEFYFYDAGTDEYLTLAYFMLNTTPISSENGFDAFLLLPEVNSEGSWYNMQRNIYDDYVAAFGAPSACRLYGVAFSAQAGTGGRVEVLFDDLYLYIDPEPEITDVGRLPEDPLGGQPVSVNATVYDLSLDSVVLYYSVNNGTWTGAEMMLVGSEYSGVIPAQVGGSEVDYYVEATDAFGNVAQSDVHSYVVTPGANLLPIAAGAGAVVAVVVLVLLYMFYVKPKQAAK